VEHIHILTDAAPVPHGAYDQAIRVGNMVITSSYMGLHPSHAGIITGGFEAEFRQAMHNIAAVLAAAGCTLRDVVRVNVSLTDLQKYTEMDRLYREYFHPPYPTRRTIGVKELLGGAQVEIDVWAIVQEDRGHSQ
jgi:2-iminobutanoate/2-iminopropanoate deaminase